MNSLDTNIIALVNELLRVKQNVLTSYEIVCRGIRLTLDPSDGITGFMDPPPGKLMVAGCGGSMCDAMHFVGELVGWYDDREASGLAAVALCDPGIITAIGNDKDFTQIFRRQVQALASHGDSLLLISTSGESESVIRAAEYAASVRMPVFGLIGRKNSSLSLSCDHSIELDIDDTPRAQEVMKVILHSMAQDMAEAR